MKDRTEQAIVKTLKEDTLLRGASSNLSDLDEQVVEGRIERESKDGNVDTFCRYSAHMLRLICVK